MISVVFILLLCLIEAGLLYFIGIEKSIQIYFDNAIRYTAPTPFEHFCHLFNFMYFKVWMVDPLLFSLKVSMKWPWLNLVNWLSYCVPPCGYLF